MSAASVSDEDWDEVGFVIGSKYRLSVLERLQDGAATPSTISEDEDISIASVSHALSQLRERELVDLLVDESRRKGRIYGLTERGGDIATQALEVA